MSNALPSGTIEEVSINTIRTLVIDAVQLANSGHPGTPMALAPLMYQLWQRNLRFDPDDPIWPSRDRFVLSAGHASMLLYATLHLTGVKEVGSDYEVSDQAAVSLEDIRRFRQAGSRCPGHPEYHVTTGVETTTGPLGQGVATSVGMALAERWLAGRYNRPGFALFDYSIFAVCSDGDLMEGVASEACSLAGHMALANLCLFYDSNHITIEGSTKLTFTEDVAARFLAYGWNVWRVDDANDLSKIQSRIDAFKRATDRPTLVIVTSHIGYGAPHVQDSSKAHGEPLGAEEVRLTKKAYGWPENQTFLVPPSVTEHFAEGIGARGKALSCAWRESFERYRLAFPELAAEISAMQSGDLPAGWERDLPYFEPDPKGMATREASSLTLNRLAQNVPWIVGGSADLGSSTKTTLNFDGAGDFQADTPTGRNLHFGIREHAMAAILNGMALSKLRPFGSTYLVFSDYARPALRLSAIMELPVTYVFSHDSIGVGEDGPTHQPVEHLASLRAIPGLVVLRPADANETVEAWKVVMALRHEPAALVLSRQTLPIFDRKGLGAASGLRRGAYILAGIDDPQPQVILMASGSEVSLCLEAHKGLSERKIRSRVVSMPSWSLFERQDDAYRAEVLPKSVRARVAVEQAAVFGWERYTGIDGARIGMHSFGASAPLKELEKIFGFTPEAVVAAALAQLGMTDRPPRDGRIDANKRQKGSTHVG